MKCKHCGKDLMDGAKFCVYCGKPIEEVQPVVEPMSIEEQPIEPSIEDTKPEVEQQPDTNIIPEPTNVNVTPQEIKIEEQPIEPITEESIEPTPLELPKEEPKPAEPVQDLKAEKTTKTVKKKNPILLLIIILLLLGILALGGFYVYKNYIEKDNKNTGNNTTDIVDVVEEKDYDLTKAKELVDKYYVEYIVDYNNIFTLGINDSIKARLAINTLASNKVKEQSCYNLYENNASAVKDGEGYSVSINPINDELKGKFTGGGCDQLAKYYEYDDVNSQYRYLFGKNSEMPKSDFTSMMYSYDYIEDKNIFVFLAFRGGGAASPHYTTYDIQSAKVNGDILTINVGYVYMSPVEDDNSQDPILETTIAGEKVTYKLSETKKDTFEKEFTDKYLDKLDTYTFTFKYEDDQYVFVDMKKI